MEKFITLAELSREAGVPASRIQASVETGLIQAAGRAGRHPNSPIVFFSTDVPAIIETLKATGRIKATATTQPPHRCRNTADIIQKGEALIRAKQEGAK
jgi:late competence protein required for DNA uptake (superfamily II DNA/RNA helicase)